MNHRLHLLLVIGLALIVHLSYGQNSVGIGTNTPNANAVLHLVSPGGNQGFIVPQLTSAQRIATSFTDNLSMEVQGLLVFDTDDQLFYYWNGTHWASLSAQTLSAGTGITIGTDGIISNSGDLDETNEIQDLTLEGNTLTITNNGSATSIDLTAYLDNTDSQTLDLSSDQLTISGGNSVDLSVLKDGTGSDDQTAAEVSVSAAGNLTSTNVQDALIEIQTEVDGFTDTDDQTLSFSSNSLSIADGNTVDLSGLIDDADADVTNELQDLDLSDNVLTISGLASPTNIDLSPYLNNNTDNQTLTFDSRDATLQISDGNSVDLSSLSDGFEPNTDSQNLLFSDNLLSISGGSGSVDMSRYLDNTDEQTLSFNTSTNSLTILDGNSVDLSTLKDGTGTDNQTLSLATNTLSISGGNGISLASFKDNTDNQSLSYNDNSNQLTISGGNSVNLTRSAYQTLRPADFIPVTPEEGGVITIEITDNGNVGNFFADGSLDGQITADLELPHGATVESVAVHAARGSQSKNPIDVYLYSSEAGTVSPTIIESGQISSTAITELKLTPADLTIDNSRNVYYLVIDGEAGSTRNYYDRILHVVIAYSY